MYCYKEQCRISSKKQTGNIANSNIRHFCLDIFACLQVEKVHSLQQPTNNTDIQIFSIRNHILRVTM